MRRTLTLLMAGLFCLTAASAAFLIDNSPASAAPIADAPATYCADPDTDPSMDTGGGSMIKCVTEITNTVTAIDPVSGVASGTAHVKVTECIGPASGRLDPSFLTCSTDEHDLVNLVTHVKQCNYVGYGGGNVLECSVDVTTNFVGVSPQAILDATVNQCNVPQYAGLDKTGCDPYPATTTGATITQCNDSSYGGGQEDFNCIAPGSTTSASLSVTVNQCNNSNYGGGSWLNCSASLSNNILPLAPTPTPTEAATPTVGATPSAAPTAVATPSAAPTAVATPSAAPTAVATPSAAPTAVATPLLAATPTAIPIVESTAIPAPTPSELPDTATPRPVTPQQGGTGVPLLMIGLVLLAFPLWKIYSDRGMQVR